MGATKNIIMKYFKVKKDCNGIGMGNGWNLVANELITEAEAKKRKWDIVTLEKYADAIHLSSKTTYFQFGARFCNTMCLQPKKYKAFQFSASDIYP